MTIKEVELQAGITKANIRFYEKEGLLSPLRGANNYREYSTEDVERLKKVRVLRMMGISVADIRLLMDGQCTMASLLEKRVVEIEKEEAILYQIRELCQEIREKDWRFETLNPGFLELRMSELKLMGGEFMKKDRIDCLCRIRDMAFLFCFLCILSMIVFPVNRLLGIEMPERLLRIWQIILCISPFPALILWSITAGRARWGVPDMNRILTDSGSTLKNVEKEKGKAYERAWRFNQICLLSLLIIPVNRMLEITLPLWFTVIWVVVVLGSAVVLMIMKNR